MGMLDNFVKTMKSKIGEAMEKFIESVENFIMNSITKRQEARKKNKEKEAEKKAKSKEADEAKSKEVDKAESKEADEAESKEVDEAESNNEIIGKSDNIFNNEIVASSVSRYLDRIKGRGPIDDLSLEDIIMYLRKDTPFESRSTEGDWKKVMTSREALILRPMKDIIKRSTKANLSMEDVVAYITENYDIALEQYYKDYPDKRPQ